jgi:hypothetical protein
MTTVRDCARCSAITAKGTRCTRTTCIYPELCFQHFRVRYGLKLAPSNLPAAGLGLFTTRPISRNRKIADYTGDIWSDDDWAEDPSDYGVQYDENHTLDARSTQSAIGRYANECRTADKRAGRCRGNNSQLRTTRQRNVVLESRSRIPSNTEIFTSYGKMYWK